MASAIAASAADWVTATLVACVVLGTTSTTFAVRSVIGIEIVYSRTGLAYHQ